jgi:hypothetical protein
MLFYALLRIHDIFFGVDPDLDPRIEASDKWIRIRIRILFSSLTFKMPTKHDFFKKGFSAYHFLKVHLHHFSKINSQKEVTKQQESKLIFLLGYRRIRIQEAQKHTDPT